jgi:hypothetical protein
MISCSSERSNGDALQIEKNLGIASLVNINSTTPLFHSDKVTQVVSEILNHAGFFLQGNAVPFSINEDSSIENAQARIYSHIRPGSGNRPRVKFIKRIIEYNPNYLLNFSSASDKEKWGIKFVFTHEIGHHLLGHLLDNNTQRKQEEIEADIYAGFVLRKMGADSIEVLTGVNSLTNEEASTDYPSRAERKNSVLDGWRQADYLENLNCDDRNKMLSNPNTDPHLYESFHLTGFIFAPSENLFISDSLAYQDEWEIQKLELSKLYNNLLIEENNLLLEISSLSLRRSELLVTNIVEYPNKDETQDFRNIINNYSGVINQLRRQETTYESESQVLNQNLISLQSESVELDYESYIIANDAFLAKANLINLNLDQFTDSLTRSLEIETDELEESFRTINKGKSEDIPRSDVLKLDVELNQKRYFLKEVEERRTKISEEIKILNNNRTIKTVNEDPVKDVEKEQFRYQIVFKGNSNLYLINYKDEVFILSELDNLEKIIGKKIESNNSRFQFFIQSESRLYGVDEEFLVWSWFPNGIPFQIGYCKSS